MKTQTKDGEQFAELVAGHQAIAGPGWTLCRDISKQYDGGGQSVQQFEDCTFASFDELANKHAELMNEFIKSADNFDFSDHPAALVTLWGAGLYLLGGSGISPVRGCPLLKSSRFPFNGNSKSF